MHKSAFRQPIAVLLLCVATPCFAQARPDSTKMSCAAASSLVTTHGGIILGSGPLVYDRYVTDAAYCNPSGAAPGDYSLRPGFVPTLDNRQCFVGYYCLPRVQDGPNK